MASIPPWSPSLCDCFASGLMTDIAASKTPQRIYQIHQDHSLCCKWYLQVERARDTHAKQARPADWDQAIQQCIQTVLQSMKQTSSPKQAEQAQLIKKQEQDDENLRAEQARLVQQQIEKERQEAEEARIAKEQEEARLTAFACRRCPAKYPSNTKLHEHIRDHHAKKPKPAVSSLTPSKSVVALSPTSPPTPPESITSLPASPKPAPQSKALPTPPSTPSTPPHSITSSPSIPKRAISPKFSPTATKTSLLSGSAPEFVPKRSESASPTPPQNSAFMHPTTPCNLPSKPYLTITDLYIMFAGKSMRAKLFSSQNSPSSPGVSAPRQTRITSYFLPTAKSTKSEGFTSVHAPVKQSARASPPRSPSRPSPSVRPLFSAPPFFSPVCWRCQGPYATQLHSHGSMPIAGRVGIPVGRRGRRHFL